MTAPSTVPAGNMTSACKPSFSSAALATLSATSGMVRTGASATSSVFDVTLTGALSLPLGSLATAVTSLLSLTVSGAIVAVSPWLSGINVGSLDVQPLSPFSSVTFCSSPFSSSKVISTVSPLFASPGSSTETEPSSSAFSAGDDGAVVSESSFSCLCLLPPPPAANAIAASPPPNTRPPNHIKPPRSSSDKVPDCPAVKFSSTGPSWVRTASVTWPFSPTTLNTAVHCVSPGWHSSQNPSIRISVSSSFLRRIKSSPERSASTPSGTRPVTSSTSPYRSPACAFTV